MKDDNMSERQYQKPHVINIVFYQIVIVYVNITLD